MTKRNHPPSKPPQHQKGAARDNVAVVAKSVTQTFEGPIPHPSHLEGYERVIPGAAERILRLAEAESAHRQAQENRALASNTEAQKAQIELAKMQLTYNAQSEKLGQILGAVLSLGCVAGAIYLAVIGETVVACALTSLPLGGIIHALRKKSQSTETQ